MRRMSFKTAVKNMIVINDKESGTLRYMNGLISVVQNRDPLGYNWERTRHEGRMDREGWLRQEGELLLHLRDRQDKRQLLGGESRVLQDQEESEQRMSVLVIRADVDI